MATPVVNEILVYTHRSVSFESFRSAQGNNAAAKQQVLESQGALNPAQRTQLALETACRNCGAVDWDKRISHQGVAMLMLRSHTSRDLDTVRVIRLALPLVQT